MYMVRENFVKAEQIKYKSKELYDKLINGNKLKELRFLHIDIEKNEDIEFLKEFRENNNKLCQIYITIKDGINQDNFLKVMEFILKNLKLKKIGISFDKIADFD